MNTFVGVNTYYVHSSVRGTLADTRSNNHSPRPSNVLHFHRDHFHIHFYLNIIRKKKFIGALGFRRLLDVGNKVLVLLPKILWTGEVSNISLGVYLQSRRAKKWSLLDSLAFYIRLLAVLTALSTLSLDCGSVSQGTCVVLKGVQIHKLLKFR